VADCGGPEFRDLVASGQVGAVMVASTDIPGVVVGVQYGFGTFVEEVLRRGAVGVATC